MSVETIDRDGVHNTHCCRIHGCKYRDEDCPVESGRLPGIRCEYCAADDASDRRIAELEAALSAANVELTRRDAQKLLLGVMLDQARAALKPFAEMDRPGNMDRLELVLIRGSGAKRTCVWSMDFRAAAEAYKATAPMEKAE